MGATAVVLSLSLFFIVDQNSKLLVKKFVSGESTHCLWPSESSMYSISNSNGQLFSL